MNSPGQNSNHLQNSQEKYGTIVTASAAVSGAVGRYGQSMDTIATRTHQGSTEDGIGHQESRQHQEPEFGDTRGNSYNYSMPASELLPLQSQQESRNHYGPGWAATAEEDRNCRNDDLSNFGDEAYQRSSLYQESSTGPARDSAASNVEGRFLDTRPDQQIFRHDSNDPSAEMLQQPPAMYVQADDAPLQQEGVRYEQQYEQIEYEDQSQYQDTQRSTEVAARGGSAAEYAESAYAYSNNVVPGSGAASFGPGPAADGQRRLRGPAQRYHESCSQSDASNALTYTNTLSAPTSNHCGSLVVSAAALEGAGGNDPASQRTKQLHRELEELQRQDHALNAHFQNPFGQERDNDPSAERRLNEYLSLQGQERPALRQRSPYGAAGGGGRQLELVSSPALADMNGSTVIIDTSHDAGAGQDLGGVLDQGQYLSSDTFLPRDESQQHASLRRPSPTPNQFPTFARGRSPPRDADQLPDGLYQESQENQEPEEDSGQLEGLLAAAVARRDARGLGEANHVYDDAYGEIQVAREVDLEDNAGTQTSSALAYSIGTGQGAGIRSVAQVTSHLNRSLAILVKKKQAIDLGNLAPKAQTFKKFVKREASPEEDNIRSKSASHNFNRKYCINKLFKQATGVPLENYRKAQEYRQSVRASASTPPGAAKMAARQPQPKPQHSNGKSLRIKKSRSRSSAHRSRRSGGSRSASVKRAPEVPEESSPVKAPSEAKMSKIDRYKQIERELAQTREIEDEARWKAETYQRRAEEELQQQRRQRDVAVQAERERLQVIEAARQQQFVAETVGMLKRFESDHPHLEFTGTLAEKLAQSQQYQMTEPEPRRTEEGQAEEVQAYVGLRTKSPEGGSGDRSRGHVASEMWRQRQRVQGDSQRYGEAPYNMVQINHNLINSNSSPQRSRFEATGNSGWTNEPQLLTDHYGEQTQGSHPAQGHYVSMMSIGAQAKPSTASSPLQDGFNAGPRDHIQGRHAPSQHGSNFTLGHQASQQNMTLEAMESGRAIASEQRHPLRNANAQAIAPYTLAQATCTNSQRSILRLQGMLHEQNEVLDSLSRGTSTKQALSSSFAWNQNESLLGINRSEDTRTAEVPASIHRRDQQDSRRGSGRNSKSTTSLRTKGQRAQRAEPRGPAGHAGENERERRRYGGDMGPAPAVRERSRSRPDTVPSRGPAVTDYPPVLGPGDRGASPQDHSASSPIGNMELQSKFGRRQQLSGTRAEAQPRELATQFILPPAAGNGLMANQSRSSVHPAVWLQNPGPSAQQQHVVAYHMEHQDSVQYHGSGHQEHQKLQLHDLQASVGSDQNNFDKRSKSSGNNARSKSREQRKAEYANNLRATQLEVQHCLQNLNQSLNKSLTSSSNPNSFAPKNNAAQAPGASFKTAGPTTAAGDYLTQAHGPQGPNLTTTGAKGHRPFISLEQGRNQKLSLAQQEGSRIIYLDKEQYQDQQFDANQTHLTKTQSESTLAVSQQEHDANEEGQPVAEVARYGQGEQRKQQSRSKSKTSLNARQLLNRGASEQTGSADQRFPRPPVEKTRTGSTRGQAPAKPEKPKLDEARAHKKPKGSKRQRDLQKLMALQVRQAQMLTDLLQQKSVLDSVADESELRSDGLQSQAMLMSGTQGTMRTVRSGQELPGGHAVSQKQTMDLIQAVYKQMERINQQLARKDQIEADRYQELEKKMRKLQRKYNKVSISNLHESSASIATGQQRRDSVETDPPMLIEEDGPEYQAQSQKVIQTHAHYDQAHEASRQVVLTGPITTARRGPNQHFRSLGIPAGLQGQQAQSHGLTGRSGASNDLRATSPATGLANLDASITATLNLVKSAEEKNQINFSINQSTAFNNSAAAEALRSQLARSQAGKGADLVHQYPSLQQSSSKQPEPCTNMGSEQFAGDHHHLGGQNPSSPSQQQQYYNHVDGSQMAYISRSTQDHNQILLSQWNGQSSGGPEADSVAAQRSGAPGTARTARAAIEAEEQKSNNKTFEYQLANPVPLTLQQAPSGAVTSIRNVHQKLQTIQSIGNEQEQSSSVVISSLPQTLQQPAEANGEAGRVATGQSVVEDEGELEAQMKQMNGAIVNLAEEHRAQMEEMKQQCEQQIQQVRAEYIMQNAAGASREASFAASLQANYIHGVQAAAPIQYVSQEALARLMDQGKFQETIQQLTEAVGQKESLEQKLLRIKEKIQKAKEIKQHSIQTSPPSAGSGLVYSGCSNPAANNQRMPSAAIPVGGLGYQTFRPPPQRLPSYHQSSFITSQSGASYSQQAPPLPPSNGSQQAIRPQNALPRTEQSAPELQHSHSNSVQPSPCTASQYVSHRILEKAGSSQDFERGLNFQYVSKDLKAGASQQSSSTVLHYQQRSSAAGLPAAARTAAGAHKFIETFNPHSGSGSSTKPAMEPVPMVAPEGSYDSKETRQTHPCEQVDNLNDVYLRDTTQSMMYIDLNSESQRGIMLNESKGINQKIVDLQRLRQEKEGQRAAFYEGLQGRTGQRGAEMGGQQPVQTAGRERAEDATSDYHNQDPYTFSKHHAANFGREALPPNVQVANPRLHFHEAANYEQTEPTVTEFDENWKEDAGQSLDARTGMMLNQSSARSGLRQPHRQESLSLDEFAGSFEGASTQLAAPHQTSCPDWTQAAPTHARRPSSGAGQTLATYQQVRQGHSTHISHAQSSVTHQLAAAGHFVAPPDLRDGAQTPATEMHVLQHPSLFAPGHGGRLVGAAHELQSNLCISQLDRTDAMTELAAQYQGPGNDAPHTARSGQPFEALQQQYYGHTDPRASAETSSRRHRRSQDRMGSSEARHQYQQPPPEQFQMTQEEELHLGQPSSVGLSRKFLDSFTGRDGSQRHEYVQKIIQVQCRENQQI